MGETTLASLLILLYFLSAFWNRSRPCVWILGLFADTYSDFAAARSALSFLFRKRIFSTVIEPMLEMAFIAYPKLTPRNERLSIFFSFLMLGLSIGLKNPFEMRWTEDTSQRSYHCQQAEKQPKHSWHVSKFLWNNFLKLDWESSKSDWSLVRKSCGFIADITCDMESLALDSSIEDTPMSAVKTMVGNE